jgi:hypothetical protein
MIRRHYLYNHPDNIITFAETKEELPEYVDNECYICKEEIDVDEKLGVGEITGIGNEELHSGSNCLMCTNGHRVHTRCSGKMNTRNCPVCKIRSVNTMCGYNTAVKGYAYAIRKGGKKSKSRKSTRKVKSKTRKSRKTNKIK